MENSYIYKTKLGIALIAEDGVGVTRIDILSKEERREVDQNKLTETPLLKQCVMELEEYLEGKRKEFTVKLRPKGTVFQEKVWEALRLIPYGETWSYKDVAITIGNPKASRAVGMANNKNPIMIAIPCHRVIGANGALVGYGGGLEMKTILLELEKRNT